MVRCALRKRKLILNILALVLNNFSGNNITYYFAKVSLDCSTVVYTDQATITVLKSVAGTISGSGSVCLGNRKTLTLSGSIGKIQWQSSADNISFTDIAGATASTYISVIGDVANKTYQFTFTYLIL